MATLTDEMKLKPFKKIWTMVAVTLYNLHTCHNFLIYHLFSKKFRVACWNLCCHHFMLTNRRRKTPKQRQGNLYQPIRFISSSKKNDAKLCTKGITPDPGYIPIIRIAEDKTLREFGIIHKISGNSRRPLLPQPSSSELLDYKPRGVYRHMPDCEEQIPLKPLFLAVPDPYEVCKNGGSDCIHQRCTSKTDENQNENFRVIPVSV